MIHDPFDCQMLVEVVTDWLEGALPEATRDELELHLATCAGCVAYVEQMRATTSVLGRLESIETVDDGGDAAGAADDAAADAADDAARRRLLAVFRARKGS